VLSGRSPLPTAVGGQTDDRTVDRSDGQEVAGAGVALVGLNVDGGDLGAGERGLLSLPDAGARFEDNVACAVSFAGSLGTTVLNALYGNRVDGVAPQAQDEIALERLAYAAGAAARVGARVVLETQNPLDSPSYPLRDPAQAAAIVEEMHADGHENVGLLCDYYHLAVEGYDLVGSTDAFFALIDHVQIADAPGRHEPGTGGIDYERVLGHLAGVGYGGWVGCEYRPSGKSAESFGWLESFRSDRPAVPDQQCPTSSARPAVPDQQCPTSDDRPVMTEDVR